VNKGLRLVVALGILTLAYVLPLPKAAYANTFFACSSFQGKQCSGPPVHCTFPDGSLGVCVCSDSEHIWACGGA
jgi:hypothetical protein